jgi:hypothetical protein
MHSKFKGNIGQFYVSAKLAELGFSVFSEEGDISKIDLIAEKDGNLIRLQVKARTPVNNTIQLDLTKSGPNYKFAYTKEMFDFFAVVDLISKQVYLVPVSVLETNKKQFTLRLVDSKHDWGKVNLAADYLAEEILRDYTGDTQTEKAVGNDIVQTTTQPAA